MSLQSAPAYSDAAAQHLAQICGMVRELSRQTDAQRMLAAYVDRLQRLARFLILTRRAEVFPNFRITLDSAWTAPRPASAGPGHAPLLCGGLLADLFYADEPRIIDVLRVDPSDSAAAYLSDGGSLLAIPLFEQGVAQDMLILQRAAPHAFTREELPEHVLISNLFGRARHVLALSAELRTACEVVNRELSAVADMQRALLPRELPQIPNLDLAAYYETSRHAGGDYYDFFPLPQGPWGILIADVSGHGTPAAVLMAITHTIAHTHPNAPCPPGRLLTHLNEQLVRHYTGRSAKFVTAFYAVYDPAKRLLTYANAGHNPPRLKRCRDGNLLMLRGQPGIPLGIAARQNYGETAQQLEPGDQIVFYTDGVTEAFNPSGEMFGTERLDRVLADCSLPVQGLMQLLLTVLADFTAGHPLTDDRTLLLAKVR